MKYNKKGIVLLPMIIIIFFFLLIVIIITYNLLDNKKNLETQTIDNIKTSINNGRSDIISKMDSNAQISNSKINSLGVTILDSGNNKNSLIGTNSQFDNQNVNIINQTVTQKTPKLEIIDKIVPNNQNNVFEIDITNFLDSNNVYNNSLDNINLQWGTVNSNTSDVYVIMSKIRKNKIIFLDDTFEQKITNAKVNTVGQFSSSDDMAVNYIYIPRNANCNQYDKDLGFNWCQNKYINDILTNGTYDTGKFFYKIFLVFNLKDGDTTSVPFKISSSSVFGLGNFIQGDATIVSDNNIKKRIFIKKSTKNNILPYLIYSLWVKGQIEFRE